MTQLHPFHLRLCPSISLLLLRLGTVVGQLEERGKEEGYVHDGFGPLMPVQEQDYVHDGSGDTMEEQEGDRADCSGDRTEPGQVYIY